MKTYKEVTDHISSFVNFERTGLDGLKGRSNLYEMTTVLDMLGGPDKDYVSIHIAGTKGKGSISAFLANMLIESGYSVGLFTSPHMHDIRERFSVNGRSMDEGELVDVVNTLYRETGRSIKEVSFSYFEFMTLIGILFFSRKKTDFSVFECGLGGRLDSTNVLFPAACGFAPISYDHMQILGHDIREIAMEKAGIIKKGVNCVTSPQVDAVMDILMSECEKRGSGLRVVGEDIIFNIKGTDQKGNVFDVETSDHRYPDLETCMLGGFQAQNCAVAIGLYEDALKTVNGTPDVCGVRGAVKKTFLPGRMELISARPKIIVDGAQNEDSAAKLKYSIEQIFKYDKLILLLGISKDKDIKGICSVMGVLADEVILTRSGSPRAIDPFLLKGYFKGKASYATLSVREGLGAALKKASGNDIILVAGSFYVVAEVRELVFGVKRPEIWHEKE